MHFCLEICNGLEASVSDVLLAKKFSRKKKDKEEPAEQNAQPDKENQGGWVIYFPECCRSGCLRSVYLEDSAPIFARAIAQEINMFAKTLTRWRHSPCCQDWCVWYLQCRRLLVCKKLPEPLFVARSLWTPDCSTKNISKKCLGSRRRRNPAGKVP